MYSPTAQKKGIRVLVRSCGGTVWCPIPTIDKKNKQARKKEKKNKGLARSPDARRLHLITVSHHIRHLRAGEMVVSSLPRHNIPIIFDFSNIFWWCLETVLEEFVTRITQSRICASPMRRYIVDAMTAVRDTQLTDDGAVVALSYGSVWPHGRHAHTPVGGGGEEPFWDRSVDMYVFPDVRTMLEALYDMYATCACSFPQSYCAEARYLRRVLESVGHDARPSASQCVSSQ